MAWLVSNNDEKDDDGFWYHKNPAVLGVVPDGCIEGLNALTVGWRRESARKGFRDTIRLPVGYRWLQVGRAKISADGRDLSREVTKPPFETGHTIFNNAGYLHDYFICRDGVRRIQRTVN